MTFYERYVRLWSPAIRPPGLTLVARLPILGARVVLDLGTGTGNLLSAIRTAAGPEALVIGIDASAEMLEVSTTQEPLCVMDLHSPAVLPSSCDVAVMSFVIFQLSDPGVALRKIRQLLRPGGHLGLTAWRSSGIRDRVIWKEELLRVNVPTEEQSPGSDGLTDTTEKIEGLLRGADLEPQAVWVEAHTFRWSQEDLFERGENHFHRELSAMEDGVRDSVFARVRARLATEIPDGAALDSEIIFAVATRAGG